MKHLLAQTTKFGLISASFIEVSTPVLANVNWVKTGSAANGSTVYVDSSSLRKQNNIVWYWQLQYYPKNSHGIGSTKVYMSGNCITKQIRDHTVIYYDAFDNELEYSNYGDAGKLYQFNPDSLGYGALKFACSR